MELPRLPNGRINLEEMVVNRFFNHQASLGLATVHVVEVKPTPAVETPSSPVTEVESGEPPQMPL